LNNINSWESDVGLVLYMSHVVGACIGMESVAEPDERTRKCLLSWTNMSSVLPSLRCLRALVSSVFSTLDFDTRPTSTMARFKGRAVVLQAPWQA